jgi:hypothetical protein
VVNRLLVTEPNGRVERRRSRSSERVTSLDPVASIPYGDSESHLCNAEGNKTRAASGQCLLVSVVKGEV